MTAQIVILGWGSLLWDVRPEFDDRHEAWDFDGPELKIEFSRASHSRRGALTLVIDAMHGAACRVAYAKSRRTDPEDAICDLRSREGTTRSNIGFIFADGSRQQSRDPSALGSIDAWAKTKKLDVVVWTDLGSNFDKVCGKPFSIDAAVAHVQSLDVEAKSLAVEYMWRAPAFIDTPLRRALQTQPWFSTNDAYGEVEALWNRHISGDQSKTKDDVVALLARQSTRLRQDDGELRQVTISRPTSLANAFVIGLRYQKNDESQSEDLFLVQKARPIERHYKGSLERKLPEYRGTHKERVPSTLVVDLGLPPTSVNTLSMLTRK